MARVDYYEVLGVPRDATDDDIKKAYRKLVFQYHPDRNPGREEAEARIREINAAYEIIGDAENRRTYDRLKFGEILRQEAPDVEALLQQMLEKLRDEGRRETLALFMTNVDFIKAELKLMRERTVAAQGYDTFRDDLVLTRAAEVIPQMVTADMEAKRARLLDVALQMMMSQGVVRSSDDQAVAALRARLADASNRGRLEGYAQALELFYVRR